MMIPTLLDPSLAPAGKHVMSICMQFAPYRLKTGDWTAKDRDACGTRSCALFQRTRPIWHQRFLPRNYSLPRILRMSTASPGAIHFTASFRSISSLPCARNSVGHATALQCRACICAATARIPEMGSLALPARTPLAKSSRTFAARRSILDASHAIFVELARPISPLPV